MSLDCWADFSAIGTFTLGLIGYLKYQWGLRQKSKRLENHLKQEQLRYQKQGKKGQFTMFHLVSNVGLTEDEVLQISFRNKHVVRKVTVDPQTGMAKKLLFEYRDKE